MNSRTLRWLFLLGVVGGCSSAPAVRPAEDGGVDAAVKDAAGTDAPRMDAPGTDAPGADGSDAAADGGPDVNLDAGLSDGATAEAGEDGTATDAAAPDDAGDAGTPADLTPVCAPGQVLCEGRCVETTSDPAHCGGCGVACPSGQLCNGGACGVACSAPRMVCGAGAAMVCADLEASEAHCGACGRTCLAGQRCVDGGCECAPGQTLCGGACVTTATDRAHCGGCGRACPAAQSCVAGTCACPSGQTLCAGACVDPTSDLAHCGGCGRACPAGQLCNGGTCGVTCSAPRTVCGTGATMACVDSTTSLAHCGGCGRACPTAQSCVAGTCACPAGQALCGDACVTTATDSAHCGGCGRACPAAQSCVAGTCACPSGEALCGGACVDRASDRAHCGACGVVCPAGQNCVAGACGVPCAAPRLVCGTGAAMACVDPAGDRAHCGGCGRACPAAQSCVAGACQCPSGQTLCGAACVDPASDRAHCGVCGRACPAAQSCVAGACACPAGQALCGSACVATATDSAHCGGCDRACPAAQSCVAGACACPTGRTFCAGACVDATTDLAHCGGCGRACPVPTLAAATCGAGTCGFACVPTSILVGGACTPVAPPRPLAPLSTSTVTSRRPTLRWALATGGDGARVQLCRDRACATVLATLDVLGTSVAPAADLPTGVVFWRLLPRMGGATGTATSATWEFTVGARTARDTSWGTTPDVNGDGLADVLVGAPQMDSGDGRLSVFHGRTTGPATSATTVADGPDGYNTRFGFSMASAGDVNGDGYADVIVGAYSFSRSTGRAYLYLGGAAGLPTTPSFTLTGRDGEGGWFGFSVASAGDVNGDGYADVIVGAPNVASVPGVEGRFGGRAYLYFGSAVGLTSIPTTALSVSVGESFGYSVASAGDVNGDGFADVVVGDRSLRRVFIYHGSATGPSTTATANLTRPDDGSGGDFSASLACAGDVNGDGFADLVVGAYTADNYVGRAFVYLGSTAGLVTVPATSLTSTIRTSGVPEGSRFGTSVDGAGDVNGDGYGDLIVGAMNSYAIGRASIYLGSSTGLSPAPLRTVANDDSGGFGRSVAGAGDVNGDGFADVLVGAYGGFGRVYLYAGSATGPAAAATTILTGFGVFSYFGFSVASAGAPTGGALRPWLGRYRRPAAALAGGPV